MSNARLRHYLECTPTPMVAWMIDQGYVANDGGILEYTYIGRLNVNMSLTEANRATLKPKPLVRERL